MSGRSGQRWRTAPRVTEAPADLQERGPAEDSESVARKILLDQLTGRARSRAELAVALARKGVPDDTSEAMLRRFEELGLVDDRAFAGQWVTSRRAGKGLAPRALSAELRRKGIDAEVIAEAVAAISSQDETATARDLVRARLATLDRFDEVTKARRLHGLLARKGYSPGICFSVVREELAAQGGRSGGRSAEQGWEDSEA